MHCEHLENNRKPNCSSSWRRQNVDAPTATRVCHAPQVQLFWNLLWAVGRLRQRPGRAVDGQTRLVGPLRAAPEEFHSVCSASQSARPRRSLDNQGHVYVGQVYHVPVELLLECQRVRWLLELGYGFPLLGEHLQALDGPHRRQQALQLGVGGR